MDRASIVRMNAPTLQSNTMMSYAILLSFIKYQAQDLQSVITENILITAEKLLINRVLAQRKLSIFCS